MFRSFLYVFSCQILLDNIHCNIPGYVSQVLIRLLCLNWLLNSVWLVVCVVLLLVVIVVGILILVIVRLLIVIGLCLLIVVVVVSSILILLVILSLFLIGLGNNPILVLQLLLLSFYAIFFLITSYVLGYFLFEVPFSLRHSWRLRIYSLGLLIRIVLMIVLLLVIIILLGVLLIVNGRLICSLFLSSIELIYIKSILCKSGCFRLRHALNLRLKHLLWLFAAIKIIQTKIALLILWTLILIRWLLIWVLLIWISLLIWILIVGSLWLMILGLLVRLIWLRLLVTRLAVVILSTVNLLVLLFIFLDIIVWH